MNINTVLTPEQGASIAASLARKTGGKKREAFRDIVAREKATIQERLDHLEAERQKAERERTLARKRPANLSAMHKVAAGTRGTVDHTNHILNVVFGLPGGAR